MTMNKSLYLPEPQFPYLQPGINQGGCSEGGARTRIIPQCSWLQSQQQSPFPCLIHGFRTSCWGSEGPLNGQASRILGVQQQLREAGINWETYEEQTLAFAFPSLL